MRKNFSETYFLIGFYRDLDFYKKYQVHRLEREKIGKRLKVRWEKGIDRDAFERYFKDHGITIGELGL